MAKVNSAFAQIGQNFCQHYYNKFDSNRADLQSLYTAESMLTFEEESVIGVNDIMKKLLSLTFTKVRHVIVKADYQPNPFNNGVIVFVTGDLFIDDNTNPLKFAQVFHLAPYCDSYIIVNDMFRLNIG